MKRLILILTTFVLCLRITAQVVSPFSYQAVIHDKTGKTIVSQDVTMRISILSGNAYDSVIYSEIHNVRTDPFGMVSIFIGKGTGLTGNFDSIEWNNDKYFLKVESDEAAGANFTDMGTTEILSLRNTASAGNTDLEISEDNLFISRKFVGTFLDFRHTGPDTYNGPNLIWIKTSMENVFGKISAYGKKCKFSVGDKLYLRRSNYTPGGITGYWIYQIENESGVYYRTTDFQHDLKVPVETFFK